MRKVTQLFLMTITIIAFAACAGPKDLSTNPGAMQGDWELTSMNGSEVSTDYTLSFNTDNTVAGLAGCNYIVGDYSAEEGEDESSGVVSLSSFAATNIDCESASMDSDYASAVESIGSFEVREGNTLVLSNGNSPELVFSKVVSEEEEG